MDYSPKSSLSSNKYEKGRRLEQFNVALVILSYLPLAEPYIGRAGVTKWRGRMGGPWHGQRVLAARATFFAAAQNERFSVGGLK